MCHGQVINDEIRKARKPHRCDECGRVIQAGEKYRRYRWVEDTPETIVRCARCDGLAEAFWSEVTDDACYVVGEIRSNIREWIDGCADRARTIREIVKARMEKFRC